ncbi:MAG: RidA family protein [Bacteroidia bacterium]
MNPRNPFPETDPDRHAIWEMLVRRDTTAFIGTDWSMVADDFLPEEFTGVDAGGHTNPDSWRLAFPDLETYKQEWLRQADSFSRTDWAEDSMEALFRATTLRDIEINGSRALVRKKFDGTILKKDGGKEILSWQTHYRCRKVGSEWKISGFTGYMPHPMGSLFPQSKPGRQVPEGASQHKTAGPYSPVLVVNPGQLVVISGQAAIDPDGNIIGDTIETQAAYTIENCLKQLQTAGCDARDVFKVNVYLTDLANWPRFNEVYKTYFPDPKPVRTAVQAGLLYTLLVEIELWAVKK